MSQSKQNAEPCSDQNLPTWLALEEYCQFMSIPRQNDHNDYGIYPHQAYGRSGLITLKDKSSLDSEKSLLLKVVEESLRVEFNCTNPLKCVLILNDGQIRSFHFHDENEYWRFLFGLKSASKADTTIEGECNYVVEKNANNNNGNSDQQSHNRQPRFLFYHSAQPDSSLWKFKYSNGVLEVLKSGGKSDGSVLTISADQIIGATISHDFNPASLSSHLLLLRFPAVSMMSNMISRYALDISSASLSLSAQPCVECSSDEVIVFPIPLSEETISSLQRSEDCQLKIRETSTSDKPASDGQDNSKVLVTGSFSMMTGWDAIRDTVSGTFDGMKSLSLVAEANTAFDKLSGLDKICLYRSPVSFEAMQTPKLHNKALRVFIKSASSLPQTKSSIPNAYCTVYLVGHNGDRLTSNHAEVRTQTVKSTDPEWAKEILLQDNDLGVNQVQSVMILIRDASSGFLKHHHIGQATIPISCFLEGVEAQFCLPLEPSYRMDSALAEKAFIGEIHVTTQIVEVESDKNETGNQLTTDRSDRKVIWSAKPDSKESSKAPLKLSTNNNKMMKLNCNYTLYRCSPFSIWFPCRNIVGGMKGFMCLSYDHLIVRYGHKQDDSDADIRITYDQVESIIEASSTVLLASLKTVNSIGLHQHVMLMIGPCSSKQLQLAIQFRIHYSKIKASMEKVISQIGEEEVFNNGKLGSPRSPKSKSVDKRPSSPSGKYRPNDFGTSSSLIPLKSQIMSLGAVLEERQCSINSEWGLKLHTNIFAWEGAFLKFVYRGLINMCVKHEVLSAPWRGDEISIDKVVSEWQQQVLEGSCEYDPDWCDQMQATLLHLVSTVRTSIMTCEFSNATRLKFARTQRKYLQDNLVAMQKAIHTLCATKSDFDKIESLLFKYALLKSVIQNNMLLSQRVNAVLQLSDWDEISDDFTLINHMDNILTWFVRGIAADVRKWMGKTLYSVQHHRANRMNFPWDIDLMGNFVTSSIPESFQMQLDVYADFMFQSNWIMETMSVNYYSTDIIEHIQSQFTSLNKDLRAILSNAWILPLHEYNRALSSRHWDEFKDSIEQKCYTEFLCSIINDGHRIKKLSVARDPDNLYIQSEIDRMVQLAIACLVKVIFSATQETILNMNALWYDEGSTVSHVITHNIANYSKQIRGICFNGTLDTVLLECFTVVTMRYLILFRDRLGTKTGAALDVEDIGRLRADVERFKTLAQEQSSDGEIPSPLSYLINFVNLVTEDPTGPQFNTSLLWIMRQYDMSDRDQLVFVELLLLNCALPLRHDADEDAYSTILSVFDSHGDLEKYTLHIGLDVVSNDPYYRCFGRLLSHWSSNNNTSNTTSSSTMMSQLGKMKQMQPKVALKMLREKTSDLVLSSAFGGVSVATQRQNEGYALSLLRDIGLEKEKNEVKRVKIPVNDTVLKYFGDISSVDDEKDKPSIASLLDGLTDSKARKAEVSGNKGRRLEISEVKVRGLHSFSIIGEANPYVYFEVGDEKVKTSVKWNHREADWEDTFSVQISTEQLTEENLLVEVYDKERIRRKRLLGSVVIKLHSLLSCNGGSWYALEGGEKSSSGEVHLQLAIK